MATITLNYDARNAIARKTIEYILSLGVFEKKETPYNKEFVKKIERSMASEGKAIKTEDLWK